MAALLPFLLLMQLLMLFEGGLGQDQYGQPVRSCPPIGAAGSTGFYYIADTVNPCVVWLCFNGQMVGNTPFKCPTGMGIDPGVQGTSYNRCRPLAQCGTMATPSTTTEATTVIDSSQSIADIYTVQPGSYIPNGHPQSGVVDFHTCFYSCIQTVACKAFDFDALRSICFFHPDATACDSPEDRPFSVHLRLSSCEMDETTMAELTAMLPNYRIPDAVEQPGITGFTLCLLDCVQTDACSGFEVDTQTGTCYFHDVTTVCQQPEPRYYRSLYRLDKCPAPTTGASTTTATTEAITPSQPNTQEPTSTQATTQQVVRGYHLFNGHLQDDIHDEDLCISTCVTDDICRGVDWNYNFLGCWFHTLERECQVLQEAEGVVHYRLTDLCGPILTVAPPTIPVTAPTTSTTTTPPTTTEPTTLPPLPPPPGYVSVSSGMNIQNARRRLVDATEQQCLDACLMTSFCLAVDYNSAEMTCWMHGLGSYCNPLEPCDNCNHFQRVPCVDGVDNDIVEVNYKFHALDGEELCVDCSTEECLAACFNDSSCYGVDYDERGGGACFSHDNETICQGLRQKDYCTHYSREPCSLALIEPGPQPGPQPYQTPTGDFMKINYMGPTSLPSGWQAYPGMEIDGGEQIGGPDITGDDCIELCEDDGDCLAVNYDSDVGTCTSLTSDDEKCEELSSENHIYHAKKPPICDFMTRTSDPYPDPIGVAP